MIPFYNPPSLEKIPPAYVQAANVNTSACNQFSSIPNPSHALTIPFPYDHTQPYGPSAEDPSKPYKPYGEAANAANETIYVPTEQLNALKSEMAEHPNSADSLSPFNPYNPESPLDPYNPNQFFDPNKPHEKWYGKSYEVISKHSKGDPDTAAKDLTKKLEQLKTLIAQDPNPSHHYRFLQTSQSWLIDFKCLTEKTEIVVFQDFEDTELSQNQDVQDPS